MAVHQIERVLRPQSIEEAWHSRLEDSGSSRFLAGGVDLVLYAPPSVTTLIDLSGLGLGGVRREGDDLVIGAMATITEVLEAPESAAAARGFLSDVLRKVASPLQRNVATIGGAVVRAHPWSDVVTGLLALDARLDVFDGQMRSFHLELAREERGEPFPLVLSVRLPGAFGKVEAAFEKFSRVAFDVAILNCACSLRCESGICHDVRVVVGGTPAVARRLSSAEAVLAAGRMTSATIDATAQAAAEEVDARDDRRATSTYRRTLTAVGVRRCLEAIARRGGGVS